jgi:predicted ATP-dependent endonuclease of OLD family
LIEKSCWIKEVFYQNIRGLNGTAIASSNNNVNSHYSSLQLSQINIIIGENGSGKTSLLDAINAPSNPKLWPSLLREFLLNGDPSILILKTDAYSIEYTLYNKDILDDSTQHILELNIDDHKFKPPSPAPFISGEDISKVSKVIVQEPYLNVESFSLADKDELINNNFSQELELISEQLCGIGTYLGIRGPDKRLSFRVEEHENGRKKVGIFLKIDEDVPNFVKPELLPAGWYAYGLITSFLSKQKDTTCLFDEPEVHMHPKLKKLLISRMKVLAEENNLQLIITTHSAELMNESQDENCKLFRANSSGIREENVSKEILDELGYKPSDLLQTDGLIWVEGPSDRIYLLSWLTAYAIITKNEDTLKKLNYNFVFYGGSTIKHFGIANNLIDLLNINQNAAILMDNDNEYDYETKEFNSENKESVYNAYNQDRNFCWITHGYTIENYLPEDFIKIYFVEKDSRLKKNHYKTKVEIARDYVYSDQSQELLNKNQCLFDQVESLFNTIKSWNS